MDEVRIGDAERDDALHKLGEHLAAGRIDIEEHSERSSRIIAGRTRGDVRAVFADLPEPRPLLDQPPTSGPGVGPAAPVRTNQPGSAPVVPAQKGSALRRFAGGLTPLVWCVCIAVFVMAQVGWWVFLVPIAYSVLLSAWGQAAGDPHKDAPKDKNGNRNTDGDQPGG
jgi:hypothetical protein